MGNCRENKKGVEKMSTENYNYEELDLKGLDAHIRYWQGVIKDACATKKGASNRLTKLFELRAERLKDGKNDS